VGLHNAIGQHAGESSGVWFVDSRIRELCCHGNGFAAHRWHSQFIVAADYIDQRVYPVGRVFNSVHRVAAAAFFSGVIGTATDANGAITDAIAFDPPRE